MKVIRGYSTRPDHPATSPFPLTNGVLFELRGGDVCDPYFDPDGWFGPRKPFAVLRDYVSKAAFPYLALRYGRFGMYVGAKIYGVDSPNYPDQLCEAREVYEGSLALCFTIRFSKSLE